MNNQIPKIPTKEEVELAVALSLVVNGWTPELKTYCENVQGQFISSEHYMSSCPDIVRAVGNSNDTFFTLFPEERDMKNVHNRDFMVLVEEVLDKNLGG